MSVIKHLAKRKDFSYHFKSIHQDIAYDCSECKKKIHQDSLTRHIKSHHSSLENTKIKF